MRLSSCLRVRHSVSNFEPVYDIQWQGSASEDDLNAVSYR
jgi:hypothetical protein